MKAGILLICIFIFTDLWAINSNFPGPRPKGICRLEYKVGEKIYNITGSLMGDYIITCNHCGINSKLISITCSPDNKAIDIKDTLRTPHPEHDLQLIQLSKKYPTDLSLPDTNVVNFYWNHYNNDTIYQLEVWGYGNNKEANGLKLWPDKIVSRHYLPENTIILRPGPNGKAEYGDGGGPMLLHYNKKSYVFAILDSIVIKGAILSSEKKHDIIAEIIGDHPIVHWIKRSNQFAKYALRHKVAFITKNKIRIQSLLKASNTPALFISLFSSFVENPSKSYTDSLKENLNLNIDFFIKLGPSQKELMYLLKSGDLDHPSINRLIEKYINNITYKHEFNDLNKLITGLNKKTNYSPPSHLLNQIELFKKEKYANAHGGIKKTLSYIKLCFLKISSMIKSFFKISNTLI